MGRSERGMQVRRDYDRRWYREHKAEVKEYDRQKYLNGGKEKQVEHNRQWRAANRERYNANARAKRKSYSFYGTERHKGCKILGYIRQRCNNPKKKEYVNYGGRGIKCLLSIEDILFLRRRDGADDMKHPSIHRINNDGDYTLENCQYLELSEHMKIEHKRNNEKDLTVK